MDRLGGFSVFVKENGKISEILRGSRKKPLPFSVRSINPCYPANYFPT